MHDVRRYVHCPLFSTRCVSANSIFLRPRVRRHLLCPLFATRLVSAFFFRAQKGAAARHDGGLKEGRRRVRRFGPRSCRRPGFRKRFSYALPGAVDRRGPRASAAEGTAVCKEVQYLNMFQPLYRGSDIPCGHSAPVMKGEGIDGDDALC